MSDTADLRHKADTCLRLAEAASSARANELFKRLAEEYRAQAAALETPMPSPSLAPPPIEDAPPVDHEPVASMASLALRGPAEDLVVADMVEADEPMAMDDVASPCLAPMPEVAPVVSPVANSAQWLAELQALRARL